MTPRKHPSAAFWITVALVAVLVGYPLSFGPACWISSRIGRDYWRGRTCKKIVADTYQPILRFCWENDTVFANSFSRYASLFADPGWKIYYNGTMNQYQWARN